MKYIIVPCLFSLIFMKASGQYKIKGFIRHKDGTRLGYSSVTLKSNSKIIKSVLADSVGRFSFEDIGKGVYGITVSYLGEKVSFDEFTLNRDTSITVIFQTKDAKQLSQVTVIGKRPLLERKADRLIFNIEDAPALQGLDLSEALISTPMIKSTDDGLSIVGKSGVSIMVNDRLVQLSGAALMTYLKTLRSDNVARIEIITSPPARYDAQGNSGMINIVLKKNPNTGFSGSIKGTYILRSYNSVVGTGVLNFQSEKLSTSLSLVGYDSNMAAQVDNDIFGNTLSILQKDRRKDFNNGLTGNLNVDYRINKKSNAGFAYSGIFGSANLNISSTSEFATNTLLDSTLLTQSTHRNRLSFNTGNVYFDLKLDTNGKKLSVTGNYLGNGSNNPVNFKTQNPANENAYTVKNTSDVNYEIFSGQADLELPFEHVVSLETGVKYSKINNGANVGYYNKMAEDFIEDPLKSNIFEYHEKNYAAYVSGSKNFGKKWSGKAGLRYEYTEVDGNSSSENGQIGFSYGKLFPTVYLSYVPNGTHQFSANYSRRINRPGFSQLNPFRWYSNPYSYFVGNPELQPSYNNNLEFSYVYKGNLSATVYNQKTTDAFAGYLFTKGTTTINTYLNYLTNYSTGFNVYYNITKIKWLQSIVFADLSYIKATSKLPEFIDEKGAAFSYQINNNIFLNKQKTYVLIINYSHSLPSWVGNIKWSNRANFTAGLNSMFFDKKLQVSLIGGDLFRQTVSKGQIYLRDNYQRFNGYYDARRATLNVTYNFGNNKVKAVNKNTRFDEKNRAN